MVFQMQQQLDDVFQKCRPDTLDDKTTALVSFATQLAADNEVGALESFHKASRVGASDPELSMAACLAACNCGPRVTGLFAKVSGKTKQPHDDLFKVCSDTTLDTKTHHLISLAVCLSTNCVCASGHLVRLKELNVDEASVHRAACIAAEECGLTAKYSYIEHLENVRTCAVGCVCS